MTFTTLDNNTTTTFNGETKVEQKKAAQSNTPSGVLAQVKAAIGQSIGTDSGDQRTQLLLTRMKELYTTITNSRPNILQLGIYATPDEGSRAIYPTVSVTHKAKIDGKDKVLAVMIAIENSQPLAPLQASSIHNRVEIPATAANVITDPAFRGKFAEEVAGQLGLRAEEVMIVDAAILRREVQLTQETALDVADVYLSYAFNAINRAIKTVVEDGVIDLTQLDIDMTFSHQANNQQYIRHDGTPVRADLATVISLGNRQQDASQTNFVRGDHYDLVTNYSYVDFKVKDNVMANQGFGNQFNNSTKCLVPVLTVTQVDAKAFSGPKALVYSLMAATAAIDPEHQPFMIPFVMAASSKFNPNDVGALTLDANIAKVLGLPEPARIDTANGNNDQGIRQLMNSLVDTSSSVVIYDVDLGIESLLSELMFESLNTESNGYKLLIAEFNRMTGGKFGQYYEKAPLFIDVGLQLPGGYFIDVDKQPKDIRNLGYVGGMVYSGLTSKGKVDPVIGAKLSHLLYGQMSDNERMLLAEDVYSNVKLHRTTYTRRLVVNPNVLRAINLATQDVIKMARSKAQAENRRQPNLINSGQQHNLGLSMSYTSSLLDHVNTNATFGFRQNSGFGRATDLGFGNSSIIR